MKRALYVLIALAIASVSFLASAQEHNHAAMAKGAGMDPAMCEKHMKASAEADAKLQTLVTQMNSATGQAKVDAMSAVITELLAQRKSMSCDMAAMGGDKKMAGHAMGAGMMKDCPMHGEKAAAKKE